MVNALYPAMASLALAPRAAANAVAAAAEGYAFPTDLDRDPPVGGMAPKSQAVRMIEALEAGTAPGDFAREMAALAARRREV